MDTNLITILKLISEQKAVVPAGGQSVFVWTMILSALTPVLTAIVLWIGRLSQDRKMDKHEAQLAESVVITKEIKKDVNSDRTSLMTKLDTVNERLVSLEKANSTLIEEKRGHDLREATALVPVITSAPAVRLTDAQLSEMVTELQRMLAQRTPAPKA